MSNDLRSKIIVNLEGISEASGGNSILKIIDDLEDFYKLDNDPDVNYIVGWLHGVMACHEIPCAKALLEEFGIPPVSGD